jgi:hypothetical protein
MLAKRLKRCSILLFAFLLADASGSLLESSGGQAEAIGPQISPATEGEGKRRSLATGMFCVALPNADPTALQEGLNWACGQGHANCAAIQPGGPCYKANNLPALASYAYNDYYQRNSGAGATCSFNGTATTTATDPSKPPISRIEILWPCLVPTQKFYTISHETLEHLPEVLNIGLKK